MRILHLVHGQPPEFLGGTEGYVAALARAEAAAGHTSAVVSGTAATAPTARFEGPAADGRTWRLRRPGLCGDHWAATDSVAAEARLATWLRRFRPEVVHLHHFFRLCRSAARLAAAAGVPVVWTLHDVAVSCPRMTRVLPDGALCRVPMGPEVCRGCAPLPAWVPPEAAAALVRAYREDLEAELRAATVRRVPSRAQGEFLAAVLGLPTAAFRVVPLGSWRRLRPSPPQPEPGRLRLVTWGHWYRDKGLHVLLDALRRLPPAAAGRVTLTVYGRAVFPAYGAELRRGAAGLPVTWADEVDLPHLPAGRFDLAVFPTLCHESYGFVLDEAFQLGLPVAASRVGAFPERIGPGGATVPPGDPDAWAALLAALHRNPAPLARWRGALPRPPSLAATLPKVFALYAEAQRRGPPPHAPSPPRRTAARRLWERVRANRELALAALAARLSG